MSHISVCRCNGSVAPPVSFIQAPLKRIIQLRQSTVTTSASKFGGFSLNSIFKGCKNCEGRGAIQCPGCKMLRLPRIWTSQLPQLWKGRIDPRTKRRKIRKLQNNQVFYEHMEKV
ncbi:uncharacterized protein [Cicer arietinum]|uniref:Uncharacterized protein LOC101496958 isoform X1 n=1 Tax=Cicer arietinum TaxID=3827 RepID=A0A3Q7XSI5_CICAR|nr:uncharacterized protein LOC101496958 isoform X1 [Cicer arietinum]